MEAAEHEATAAQTMATWIAWPMTMFATSATRQAAPAGRSHQRPSRSLSRSAEKKPSSSLALRPRVGPRYRRATILAASKASDRAACSAASGRKRPRFRVVTRTPSLRKAKKPLRLPAARGGGGRGWTTAAAIDGSSIKNREPLPFHQMQLQACRALECFEIACDERTTTRVSIYDESSRPCPSRVRIGRLHLVMDRDCAVLRI